MMSLYGCSESRHRGPRSELVFRMPEHAPPLVLPSPIPLVGRKRFDQPLNLPDLDWPRCRAEVKNSRGLEPELVASRMRKGDQLTALEAAKDLRCSRAVKA